jgi:hypothetical protein
MELTTFPNSESAPSSRRYPIEFLGELVSIDALSAFVGVCGAVVYSRKNEAEIFRPFRPRAARWRRASRLLSRLC